LELALAILGVASKAGHEFQEALLEEREMVIDGVFKGLKALDY